MEIIKVKLPILLYSIFSLVVLTFIWNFRSSDLELTINLLEYKNLFDILIIVSFIYYQEKFEFFGKSYNIFIIIFIFFHLGIPISNSFVVSESYFNEYITTWYYSENTVQSLIIINIFILFYFSSSVFKVGCSTLYLGFLSVKNNILFFKYIFILLSFFVLLWIFTVYYVFGIKEYSDIYSEGKNTILSLILIFIPQFISFSFIVLITQKKYFYKSWVVFLIWAVFAFNLGIRGPVLFPISLSLAILVAIHKYKITMFRFILVLLLFCIIITYKFFSRANLEFELSNLNPLLAFQEMGSSLRPLNEVISWLNTGIYNYQYGLTYFAPIERAFIGIFPIYDLPIDVEDIRLMNIAISKNAGPYGFSIIAESFINFGLFGVAILGVVLSFILRKIDLVISKVYEYPFYIIILLGLFFHIRQAFVGAWGVIVYLSIYFLFIYLFSKLMSVKNEN